MNIPILCVALFVSGVVGIGMALPVHAQTFTPEQIERVVAMYFNDAPVMVEVARCESGLRHYLPNGSVLRGGNDGMMVGLFQLHERYHRAPAQQMGINIDSLVGNLLYTRHLYNEQGVTPWRSCVPHGFGQENGASNENVTSTLTSAAMLTQRLTFGARHPEVGTVQEVLAREGYLNSAYTSGHFDIPTMRALVRFQCEQGITCGAGGSYVEYGATGEQTRSVLQRI